MEKEGIERDIDVVKGEFRKKDLEKEGIKQENKESVCLCVCLRKI